MSFKHIIVSALIDNYSKGDRVVVNINTTKEPEYYVASVTKISRANNLVYVLFDDGEKWQYKATSSKVGILGHALKSKKRKSEIKPRNLDKWLSTSKNDKSSNKTRDITAGERVAFKNKGSDKYTYGVVVYAKGSSLVIETDAYTEVNVKYNGLLERDSNVLRVRDWKMTSRAVAYESLTITDQPIIEFFRDKSQKIVLSQALVRSGFYYIDSEVFKGTLKEIPEFILTLKNKKNLGVFSWPRGVYNSPDTKIRLNSIKLQTAWLMISTLAHEMVHQWQYEQFGPDFVEDNGWHGKTFHSWQSKLENKLKVPLAQTNTAEEFEEFVKLDYIEPSGRRIAKPNFVVVYEPTGGSTFKYAMAFKDRNLAYRGASLFVDNDKVKFVGIYTFPYGLGGTEITQPKKTYTLKPIKPPIFGMLEKFSDSVDKNKPVSPKFDAIAENNSKMATPYQYFDDTEFSELTEGRRVLDPYYVVLWAAPNYDGRHWTEIYHKESAARSNADNKAALLIDKYGFPPNSVSANVLVLEHNIARFIGISSEFGQVQKTTARTLLDHLKDPDDIGVSTELRRLRELTSELEIIRRRIANEVQMNRKVELNIEANRIKKEIERLKGNI